MRRGIVERIVLGAVCVLAVLTITFGQTIAATKKAKEPAPTVAHAKPAKQQDSLKLSVNRRLFKSERRLR
jgi:hypothetical protein